MKFCRVLACCITFISGCGLIETSPAQMEKECGPQVTGSYISPFCGDWVSQRKREIQEQRESDEAQRRAAAIKNQQAQKELLRQQAEDRARLEEQAIRADEVEGYKYISFEDFALDAKKMQGSKISIRGIYVEQGARLLRDGMAVARWSALADENPSANIPLFSDNAARDARKMLMQCDSTSRPAGCEMVIRGRIKSLALQNKLGAKWDAMGIVVDSVRQ